MKFRILLAFCCFAPVLARSAAAAPDVGKLVEENTIWGAAPVDFFSAVNVRGKPLLFDWASQTEKGRANYPAYANSPALELWGLPVWDAVAIFEDDRLAKLECTVYNKGDAEVREQNDGRRHIIRTKQTFINLLDACGSRLTRWTGSKGENMDDQRLTTSGTRIMRRMWVKKPYLAELRWSFSEQASRDGDRFVAEYVIMSFKPYSREEDPTILHMSSIQDRYKGWAKDADLTKNVRTSFKEDVYVADIPMVNQGEKGYCVVAALERMLRYYGCEIDKHALAQMAQTSGTKGTSVEVMLETLNDADVKLGIHVDSEYILAEDLRDYQRLVDKYNRWASRLDKPEVAESMWSVVQGRTRMYDIQRLFDLFDPEVYKQTRLDRFTADYNRFKRALKQEVDAGRPVLWGVWLNMFPEPELRFANPQVFGHARLIIGYNLKSEELLYSDTWGRGHEMKRMPLDQAWTITSFVTTIKPRERQY